MPTNISIKNETIVRELTKDLSMDDRLSDRRLCQLFLVARGYKKAMANFLTFIPFVSWIMARRSAKVFFKAYNKERLEELNKKMGGIPAQLSEAQQKGRNVWTMGLVRHLDGIKERHVKLREIIDMQAGKASFTRDFVKEQLGKTSALHEEDRARLLEVYDKVMDNDWQHAALIKHQRHEVHALHSILSDPNNNHDLKAYAQKMAIKRGRAAILAAVKNGELNEDDVAMVLKRPDAERWLHAKDAVAAAKARIERMDSTEQAQIGDLKAFVLDIVSNARHDEFASLKSAQKTGLVESLVTALEKAGMQGADPIIVLRPAILGALEGRELSDKALWDKHSIRKSLEEKRIAALVDIVNDKAQVSVRQFLRSIEPASRNLAVELETSSGFKLEAKHLTPRAAEFLQGLFTMNAQLSRQMSSDSSSVRRIMRSLGTLQLNSTALISKSVRSERQLLNELDAVSSTATGAAPSVGEVIDVVANDPVESVLGPLLSSLVKSLVPAGKKQEKLLQELSEKLMPKIKQHLLESDDAEISAAWDRLGGMLREGLGGLDLLKNVKFDANLLSLIDIQSTAGDVVKAIDNVDSLSTREGKLQLSEDIAVQLKLGAERGLSALRTENDLQAQRIGTPKGPAQGLVKALRSGAFRLLVLPMFGRADSLVRLANRFSGALASILPRALASAADPIREDVKRPLEVALELAERMDLDELFAGFESVGSQSPALTPEQILQPLKAAVESKALSLEEIRLAREAIRKAIEVAPGNFRNLLEACDEKAGKEEVALMAIHLVRSIIGPLVPFVLEIAPELLARHDLSSVQEALSKLQEDVVQGKREDNLAEQALLGVVKQLLGEATDIDNGWVKGLLENLLKDLLLAQRRAGKD